LLLQLSQINNIYGIKDASENLNLLHVKNYTSDFAFLSGNDENIIHYLLNGGDGLISVISNIYPQEMCNIYQEIINKNITIAQQVFDKLVNLMKMLFVETNPIPIKELIYFIYHQQLDFRLPLDHILLENKEKIIKCFQEVNDEYPYSW
jgi:4-hydroxy-tetrahydrodipicolinate synthase